MTHLSAGAIEALIRLLADDDPQVMTVARDQLIAADPERVLPHIANAVRSPDPVVRGRARILQGEIRIRDLTTRWHTLASAAEVDLEAGAFLVARYRYPELDEGQYRRWLDAVAAGIAEELMPGHDMYQIIGYLNLHLIEGHGFRGDKRTYYDPDNSCINRVIDRRRGIPITLSVLYILIAQRLGLPVYGVGMPGHFILMYATEDEPIWIDPFRRGALLSRYDCQLRLYELGYEDEPKHYLMPASHREILIRMLGNLRSIYEATQQPVQAAHHRRFMQILATRGQTHDDRQTDKTK